MDAFGREGHMSYQVRSCCQDYCKTPHLDLVTVKQACVKITTLPHGHLLMAVTNMHPHSLQPDSTLGFRFCM